MHFRYEAYSRHSGIVRGQVEAQDIAEARGLVLQQGYKPLRIAPARRLPPLEDLFPTLFQVKTPELVRFARQLAAMLASGGSLLRILALLQEEARNPRFRRTLSAIAKTLDAGGSLSTALAQHPQVFSPLFVSVVRAGEHTGRLAPALEHMADILEKEHEARQKVVRALTYPLAIMGLSMLTLGVLVTVALPPLLKVFEQMGANLPLATRLTLALVGGIRNNFLPFFLGALALPTALMAVRRTRWGRYRLDRAMLRLPVIGTLVMAGELSRFSRTVAMLLEAGVPMLTALHLGQEGCRNWAIRQAFGNAEEGLMGGRGLTPSLKRHTFLPTLFVELVLIGEESNSLHRTLRDASQVYQKQLEDRLNALIGLLEPLSTVAVGAIVGVIAFSMFAPIYSGLDTLR
ncbi:MAG: type II secretion system F family protein [Dehalococcoidia bacterium]